MIMTLLESGRSHGWRPVHPMHPTLSLATHAVAAAFVVLGGASDSRVAARPARDERVMYVAPRLQVLAVSGESSRSRAASTSAEPAVVPANVVRLVTPRVVPDRLPPIPSVDALTLAVPVATVVTDVLPDALDPARGEPSSAELLSEATDEMLAETLRGYPTVPGELEYLLERGLIPSDKNPIPVYPGQLLAAHVQGSVRVSFIVDLAGRADPRSMKVLNSTNELFTRAVRAVLPRLRFRRVQRGAPGIAILVEQPFVFALR